MSQELMKEIASFLRNYPATHYAFITGTVIIYVIAEVRRAAFMDKVAAGCASVLFCVSILDFEYAWEGTVPSGLVQQLFGPILLYFVYPFTNCFLLYVLFKNVFWKAPVRAWVYTLFCVVHTPLSAFVRYLAH
jgi:hypothetical protein